MDKKRILVVEDEVIVAKDIEKRLLKLGYAVLAIVTSGEEAIKKAEDKNPDLILMDIKLEGKMNGLEAASQISSSLDIPIVYLTAYADDETLKQAKVTAPYGYILKPYETRELHTAIEIALYKHKIEKKLKESEERYRAYVAATSQLVWILKPDEEVASEIPTWKSFFATQSEGIEKKEDCLKAIHPDDHKRVAQIFSHAAAKRNFFEVEFRIQKEDESYQRILVRGVPVLEKNGTIREWIGTSTIIKSH